MGWYSEVLVLQFWRNVQISGKYHCKIAAQFCKDNRHSNKIYKASMSWNIHNTHPNNADKSHKMAIKPGKDHSQAK